MTCLRIKSLKLVYCSQCVARCGVAAQWLWIMFIDVQMHSLQVTQASVLNLRPERQPRSHSASALVGMDVSLPSRYYLSGMLYQSRECLSKCGGKESIGYLCRLCAARLYRAAGQQPIAFDLMHTGKKSQKLTVLQTVKPHL